MLEQVELDMELGGALLNHIVIARRGEMQKFVVLSNIFHQMQRTSPFVHKRRKELDGSSLHCHMRLYVHYG